MPAATPCSADAECATGLVCIEGKCVTAAAECTSGETRPCGPEPVGTCRRGTQACVGGAWETTCPGAVTATAETCNGLDDDCDRTIDEGVTATFYVDRDGDGFGSNAVGAETTQACTRPTGFSTSNSDCNDTPGAGFFSNPGVAETCDPGFVDENCNGTVNEGCGCSSAGSSQPCCAGRGTQVCEAQDGGLTLSACSVVPSIEVCNGIDDDCDGLADELVPFSTVDGGALPPIDGGTFELDGGCSAGLGACAAIGVISCDSARFVCSATPGTPEVETCNGIDDDCDGETDEASVMLCGVSGQLCTEGSCGCPAGQSVCGTTCETLGGACSLGTGACARSGAMACANGSAVCNAVPAQPSAEICNNIDDDCDGVRDNGVTIGCYPDSDNDKYETDTTITQHCPDASRVAFGFCPLGFILPSSALGIDCEPTNASLYRNELTRADRDRDTYCVGTTTTACVGLTAPPFRRFANTCAATDDCNDDASIQYRYLALRVDADRDWYCVGGYYSQCAGANAPMGTTLAVDCRPQNADDCDDGDANLYTARTVRTDADGDGYCVGPNFSQCGGYAALAGTRMTSSCQAVSDCKDTNPNATLTCVLPAAYGTNFSGKACGIGYLPSETRNLPVSATCPVGFSPTSFVPVYEGDSGGTCTIDSPTSLTMTCASLVFGQFMCRIVGDCVAN